MGAQADSASAPPLRLDWADGALSSVTSLLVKPPLQQQSDGIKRPTETTTIATAAASRGKRSSVLSGIIVLPSEEEGIQGVDQGAMQVNN
jgi:hypothetical protein